MKYARNAKLRKPISNEKQLLDLAKEDLSLKRRMMEEMKEVNKKYTSNMAVLTNTLVSLISAVTNALSMSGFQAQPHKCVKVVLLMRKFSLHSSSMTTLLTKFLYQVSTYVPRICELS